MSATEKNKGIKLVFAGDTAVRKTCLTSGFIWGTYSRNFPSTIYVNYSGKILEIYEIGKSLSLDIWDTSRFISMAKLFFIIVKMVILVYDITRKDSFDNLKKSWYKELKEHAPQDVVIGIAGNKSDLYEQEHISEWDFAKSIDAIFSLTSAESNTGIYELIINLAKKYLGLDSSIYNKMKKNSCK